MAPVALLEQVRRDPDNVSAWRVLADWWLAASDIRGERVALELALGDPALAEPARRRTAERLAALPGLVRPDPSKVLVRTQFGVVVGLQVLSGAGVAEALSAALRSHPTVGRVSLADCPRHRDELLELLAVPELRQVRALDLSRCELGPGLGSAFSAALARLALHTLWLSENPLGAVALRGWLRSSAASELQDFELAAVDWSEELAELLATSTLKPLRLGLSDNDIGAGGLRWLVGSAPLRRCHELGLANNRLGPDALAMLVQDPAARSLRRLWLAGNPLGPSGARILAASAHLQQLEALDLQPHRTGRRGDSGAVSWAGVGRPAAAESAQQHDPR